MGAGMSRSAASAGPGGAAGVAILTLPETIVVEIKRMARAKHQSVASVMASMLEDRRDAIDAEKAYRKHVKSGRKAIPADKLYKELGLVG